MLFLRKKKQLRDRDVGLVFRWRGARRHHVGKGLALGLTVVFFGFTTYAIKIEGLREPLLTKRTGEVVMLNNDSPYSLCLMQQVENRSPFPARWDPAFDENTMGRVERATNVLEGPVLAYQPLLMPLPAIHKMMSLPSVMNECGAGGVGSTGMWSNWEGGKVAVTEIGYNDLQVSVQIVADEGIQRRLPLDDLLLPAHLMTDESFGQSFRFLVGIDSLGVVRGCLSLSGGNMEVAKPTEKQKLLAAWLRRMIFQPIDQESIMIGVIELQIEAREK